MPKNEERIDKWLWCMRVFKTRTIATEACKKGRVTINGASVKPSRPIKIGEIVDVKKPPITYTFKVLGISNGRLGAKLVPEYLENLTPQSQYDLLEMSRISGFVDRSKGLGRPTKREGRELARFREENSMDNFFLDWEDDFDDDDLEDSDIEIAGND
ncbi:MAG: RNA-binding S4 domain-containing protein [Muribaculaceae bacterium]|nr:RNA-binding S4 domain-containing protein [Muribaculaceae bacterium]